MLPTRVSIDSRMLTRTKSGILFGLALFLFCLNAVVACVAIFSLLKAEQWVMHTRDVQVAIANLNAAISRTARMRADFIASPDRSRLDSYQTAFAKIEPNIEILTALTVDNPIQQRNCAQVKSLSDQRSAFLQASIASAQAGKNTPQIQAPLSESIRNFNAQIDTLTQQMNMQEQRLLDLRLGRRAFAAKAAIVSLVGIFLVAAALFIYDYLLLNKQLSERQTAQAALQKLSARILTVQDEERRKFSRELHDSMGQLLVSIKMNLDLLELSYPGNPSLKSCSDLLDQALRETRSISYLLHPPLLDQAGFVSAAREYVDGFSQRSGIPAVMHVNDATVRLADPLELAMFRVLQESLTNILKHSKTSHVTIAVTFSTSQAVLCIQDYGRGVPARILDAFTTSGPGLGVGLAGMRERIRELHGHLEIHSDAKGTTVTATLPRSSESSRASSPNQLLAPDPA